jgi:hypothetical protein
MATSNILQPATGKTWETHSSLTHSHCLICFGSVFENYSYLFLSTCAPAEIYLNYTCYRCWKGDASTRYTACLSSGAKFMALWKPSMYKSSNFCIMQKNIYTYIYIYIYTNLLKFVLLNLSVTIYNLQSQLLLEHKVNNLFSVNKTNFIYNTVRNSKHHTYTLLWNSRSSITMEYQHKQSNFFYKNASWK